MRTIIKGTKTVEEFKKMQAIIEQKATEYSEKHMKAVVPWPDGAVSKAWIDGQGNLCIEYESGQWWHYNDNGEWW